MALRHYEIVLDPCCATLPDTGSSFTYATLARLNGRPTLMFDQGAPLDPSAIWEMSAPREFITGFGVFLRLSMFPHFPGTPPGGWTYRLYAGIEVVKPNSSQVMTSGNYFPSSMLLTAQTSAQSEGQVLSFTYQFPDTDVSAIAQDDLLRIFVGLKRSDTYSGLNLHLVSAVLYDELTGA